MAFTYKDYAESDKVKKYATDLAAYEKSKPADWTGGQYGEQMKSALDKVMNRDKFSYDINGDALYQQYKDQYVGLGKLAMQDTMGQAAALTGGYGNSYANTAGYQAYQGYLQQLNAVVPELYGMARDAYDKEGDNLINQYGLLADQYNDEYGKYRDQLADWNAQRDYLANQYNAERDLDYNRYTDNRNFAYNDYRNQVADEQWQKDYDEAIRQYNLSLAARSSSGSGGNPSSGYDDEYAELRNASASSSNDTELLRKKLEKTYGKGDHDDNDKRKIAQDILSNYNRKANGTVAKTASGKNANTYGTLTAPEVKWLLDYFDI